MPTFRELATAAYCPRKLYYRRSGETTDGRPGRRVRRRRALAFRYESLLAADDEALAEEPLAVTPTQFRTRLHGLRERCPDWGALVDPDGRHVHLEGRDCRGVAHKVLGTDPPAVSLVFTGDAPTTGVWHPQRVHVVAAATALAWDRQTGVERGYAEYPAHGLVREVPLDARRRDEYRSALAVVRELSEPPPRVDNRGKCELCEFASTCGVRTRSLRTRR